MAISEVHLALLLSGSRHGYDIKRAHDAWFPHERPLAFGQVYATLSRLVRDGLAEVVGTRTGGGPERTLYAVTAAGRERLLGWLAEPAPPAGTTGEEIVRKVVVALHATSPEAGAAQVLTAQRAAHLRRMRELQHRGPTGSPGAAGGRGGGGSGGAGAGERTADDVALRLADRHALLHLDADLRWLEEAAEELRTLEMVLPPADVPPHDSSPTDVPSTDEHLEAPR